MVGAVDLVIVGCGDGHSVLFGAVCIEERSWPTAPRCYHNVVCGLEDRRRPVAVAGVEVGLV